MGQAGRQAQHRQRRTRAFLRAFGLVDGVRSAERVCGLTIRRLQASGPGVFLKMIFGTKWTFGVPLWCAKVRNRHGRRVAIGGRGRVFLALRATNRRGRRLSAVVCWSTDGSRQGWARREGELVAVDIYALFKHDE